MPRNAPSRGTPISGVLGDRSRLPRSKLIDPVRFRERPRIDVGGARDLGGCGASGRHGVWETELSAGMPESGPPRGLRAGLQHGGRFEDPDEHVRFELVGMSRSGSGMKV